MESQEWRARSFKLQAEVLEVVGKHVETLEPDDQLRVALDALTAMIGTVVHAAMGTEQGVAMMQRCPWESVFQAAELQAQLAGVHKGPTS